MKKEKKDQIIRRISEQSMLKLTPMAFSALVKEVPSELSANNTLCSFVKSW
jgi:hypothetical protein